MSAYPSSKLGIRERRHVRECALYERESMASQSAGVQDSMSRVVLPVELLQ
jgi:hypothetical protein